MFSFRSCVCYAVCASVYLCLVITYWERADLLALRCITVSLSISHSYPGSGVDLVVPIPDLCTLTYFESFLCDESCNGVNFEFQYDDITLYLKLLAMLYAHDTIVFERDVKDFQNNLVYSTNTQNYSTSILTLIKLKL